MFSQNIDVGIQADGFSLAVIRNGEEVFRRTVNQEDEPEVFVKVLGQVLREIGCDTPITTSEEY